MTDFDSGYLGESYVSHSLSNVAVYEIQHAKGFIRFGSNPHSENVGSLIVMTLVDLI